MTILQYLAKSAPFGLMLKLNKSHDQSIQMCWGVSDLSVDLFIGRPTHLTGFFFLLTPQSKSLYSTILWKTPLKSTIKYYNSFASPACGLGVSLVDPLVPPNPALLSLVVVFVVVVSVAPFLLLFLPVFLKPAPLFLLTRIPVRAKARPLLLCQAASTHHRPCWCCTAGRQERLLLLAVPPRGSGALLWALSPGVPRQVPQTARRAWGRLVLSRVWGISSEMCALVGGGFVMFVCVCSRMWDRTSFAPWPIWWMCVLAMNTLWA